MTPQGLIFDCDGTLADTMPLHWRAWQMITQRHNLYFPEDRFYAFGGVPFDEGAQLEGRRSAHLGQRVSRRLKRLRERLCLRR